MGTRRQAREHSLQLLYQIDMAGSEVEEAIRLHWSLEPADPDVVDFANQLARGAAENLERIDELISEASTNWKVSRMSYVDRNILRLATFEFLGMDDVPPMASLNEAIELGKRFGTTESGAFINGILDRIARNLDLTGGR
jgi:transcription antitermination protein NusB